MVWEEKSRVWCLAWLLLKSNSQDKAGIRGCTNSSGGLKLGEKRGRSTYSPAEHTYKGLLKTLLPATQLERVVPRDHLLAEKQVGRRNIHMTQILIKVF